MWICAGLLCLPVAAVGGGSPVNGSPSLGALQSKLSQARSVRVVGDTATWVLRDVRLDSSGVVSARWGPGAVSRPSLFLAGQAWPPPPPRLIPWADIARIETGSTHAGRDALRGLVIGALMGAVVWRTIPTGEDGGPGPAPLIIGVPAAAGLFLGALVWGQQYVWSPAYVAGLPPRQAPPSRP
jgi:hypothetical protein